MLLTVVQRSQAVLHPRHGQSHPPILYTSSSRTLTTLTLPRPFLSPLFILSTRPCAPQAKGGGKGGIKRGPLVIQAQARPFPPRIDLQQHPTSVGRCWTLRSGPVSLHHSDAVALVWREFNRIRAIRQITCRTCIPRPCLALTLFPIFTPGALVPDTT